MKIALCIHLAALLWANFCHASVRNVTLKQDQILTIKTAIGIATIIQVPAPIQSAIIGDQSAFKVEYLNHAVTVKPLRYGAKTNLYLLTDPHRFNLRLVTLSQDLADYVVYIKEPGGPLLPAWRPLHLTRRGKHATLELTRLSVTPQGFLLLEGKLSAKTRFSVGPDQVWVKQGPASKTIQHLYLSDKWAGKDHPILVGISIHREDLQRKAPITVEIQGQEKLSLTISEASVWK